MDSARWNLRECLVRMIRCEPKLATCGNAARAVRGTEVRDVAAVLDEAVLSAVPFTYTTDHDHEFNHVVKIEDVSDEVRVKEELDVGPTVLTPQSARRPPSPHSQCRLSSQLSPDEHLCTRSLGDTVPALQTIFAQPTLSTKVEVDYHDEVLSVTGIDYDTQDGHQSTYYVRPRSECRCSRGYKSYDCVQYENSSSKPNILRKRKCYYRAKKPYKCEQCEYSTFHLSHLKLHLRTHTGEKPYKCEQCEYSASLLGNLKRHFRIHTGEKPYKCGQCEYKAFQLGNLKAHLRIHTGEKPYKCGQCEYSASRPHNLKTHLYIHTGEKPYKCKQCNYSAARLSRLNKHLRTHTRKKPYRCEQCQYSTSRHSNLKKHLHVHTAEKSYKCEKCKYKTSRQADLKRHFRIHTGK